ncbi:MAG: family hydrolase [Brevundimonas sp.]|nr:family hydrolase [Brevundimonas sp.]
MSLFDAYDPANVFARILRGELPAYTVYEDEHVLAFLDVFPQARGHTLVIPKIGTARNILEIDDEALNRVMRVVRRVAIGLVDALDDPEGVQIWQFNGSDSGGQSVFHLHVHVVPRWHGQTLGPHGKGQVKGDPAELAILAPQISAAIAQAFREHP